MGMQMKVGVRVDVYAEQHQGSFVYRNNRRIRINLFMRLGFPVARMHSMFLVKSTRLEVDALISSETSVALERKNEAML